MKKSLIAGAGVAALGLAVVPFAGVFAADDPTPVTVTDNITVTVNQGCSFSAGGTALSPSATVNAGAVANFGDNKAHSFTIKCNTKSYSVTAQATDLTNMSATEHGTISYTTNGDYTDSVKAIGTDGKWTAVLTNGKTDAAIGTTESTIKSGYSTDTDNFSVEYKAYAGTAQNQGSYTGSVTYTLTGTNQ